MFLSKLPSASCSGFIMVSIILVNTILVSTKPVTTILVTTILVHADKHTKHTCSQVCRHACICVFSECLYQSTINGCKPTTFLSPPSQTETGAATRQECVFEPMDVNPNRTRACGSKSLISIRSSQQPIAINM